MFLFPCQYLKICLFTGYLFLSEFNFEFTHLFHLYTSIYISKSTYVYISIYLPIYVYLSIHPSIYLQIHVYLCFKCINQFFDMNVSVYKCILNTSVWNYLCFFILLHFSYSIYASFKRCCISPSIFFLYLFQVIVVHVYRVCFCSVDFYLLIVFFFFHLTYSLSTFSPTFLFFMSFSPLRSSHIHVTSSSSSIIQYVYGPVSYTLQNCWI